MMMGHDVMRCVVLALWLNAVAAAIINQKYAVAENGFKGMLKYDDAVVTSTSNSLILVSYDGTANDWVQSQVDKMIDAGYSYRYLILDVFDETYADKAAYSTDSTAKMAIKMKQALEQLKPMGSSNKVAAMGWGWGGNFVLAAIGEGADMTAGVAFTPMLADVIDFKANSFLPKTLVVPGYDSIDELAALETKMYAGNAIFEVFMLHKTKVHFNIDNQPEYVSTQAGHAMDVATTFLTDAFTGAFGTVGSTEPVRDTSMETAVTYMDGDTEISGLVVKESFTGSRPAVVVIPAWGGFDEYAIHRLHYYAKQGYVAMSANIYNLPIGVAIANFGQRGGNATYWRSNPELFVARIKAAYDYIADQSDVDSGKISTLGYCFGGSGVYNAYRYNSPNFNVMASFHGSMASSRDMTNAPAGGLDGYLTMFSGADDSGESGDTLVAHLANISKHSGEWELTRYSSTPHGFTEWGATGYRAWADGRSSRRYDKLLDTYQSVNSVSSVAASLALTLVSALLAVVVAH